MNKNSGSISCFGGFISRVISLFLYFILVLTLFSIAFRSVILNPATFISTLDEQQFYLAIPDVVTEYIAKDQQPQDVSQLSTALLTQALVKGFVEQSLPVDWAKTQVDRNIRTFMDFMNLRTSELVLDIDLVPVKARITPEFTRGYIEKLLTALPACSAEQLYQLQAMILGSTNSNGMLTMCKPPVEFLDLANSFLYSYIASAFKSLPDSIILFDKKNHENEDYFLTSPTFQYYVIIRRVLQFLPYVAIILAGMIMILFWKTPRNVFQSLGTAVLLAGITYGILVFLGSKLLPGWLEQNVSIFGKVFSGTQLSQLLSVAIDDVVQKFLNISWISAGLSALIGFVLLLISRVFRSTNEVYLKRK